MITEVIIIERPKRLSASFIRTVKQPGRYGDGRGGYGLSLLVKPMSAGGLSKSFSQRLRLKGKPFNLGLGSYPLVTLAEARQQALVNARIVRRGVDPRVERKREASMPTFEEAADRAIAFRVKSWKPGSRTEAIWRARLAKYVYPRIGKMPVSDISTADVLSVLSPVWEKRETAQKVQQYVNAVMKWAVAHGYRRTNPAGEAVSAVLPKTSSVRDHFRALPYAEVSSAVQKIRDSEAYEVTKLAIEFLTLTASRSGEVRGATWDEIQGDIWTIPSGRMKSGREHRVPLSDRAIEILEDTKSYAHDSQLLFPSVRGKQLSDNTLSKLFSELQIGGTPHGLRSSFRDWAAECTEYPREICEFALAHVEGSAAELAYRRTDYFERRRGLMQQWADFVG